MPNPENITNHNNSDKHKEASAKGGTNKAGSKHLSTIIREIGDDIDWDKTNLKNKEQVKAKYGNNGWKAICYVAWTKAMAGDPQAMKWLAENGFGKNIKLEIDDPRKEILNKYMGEDNVGETQEAKS